MLNRQKIILKILGEWKTSRTRLELMKLSFLLAQEGRSEQLKSFYEYVPYKHGPYSFGLYHELSSLSKEGLIAFDGDENICLTSKGAKISRQALEPRLARDLELLFQNYSELKQENLIDLVYQKYPWFTGRSIYPKKRKAKKVVPEHANYTIGYQSLQVDGLLNRLLERGITKVIDTRANPVSRRYGFHKSSLAKLCGLLDIRYEHWPEMGIPSSWRQDLSTDNEYRTLFKKYESEILESQKESLARLAKVMQADYAALLCRETEKQYCHRTSLARHLARLNNLEVEDITPARDQSDEPLLKFNKILLA